MLLVSVQRNMDHMLHTPFLLPIHNQRSWKTNMDLILVRTTRLDLDASCNENGPNLFLNSTPCLLVPIIAKCNKLMMMEAQTFFDSSALAWFMNKELVQQYKLVLMEKSTPMSIKVIDSHSLSSRLVTHETKPLDVTIGSHISKVVFNVISSPKNLVIIGLFWFVLHNP